MDEIPALTEREEIEALLAWYVTGRLSPADRERVDAYLARYPEMRRQLALIEQDRRAALDANERIEAPHLLSADALLARLPRRKTELVERLLAPLRDLFTAPTAQGVRWAAAAVAAAFVIQGVVLSDARPDRDYETASGGAKQVAEVATVLVRFTPGVSLEAVGEALSKRDMRIVDGPKPGQLYVVAIGPDALRADVREKRAAELRALSGIVALVLAGEGLDVK